MSAWAKPGVRVECIGTSPWAYDGSVQAPVVGKVYTVRSTLYDPVAKQGSFGIRVCEIRNPVRYFEHTGQHVEPGFHIHLFRPLVEEKHSQEADVALFKSLLNTTPKHQREEA